jgi:hypothetical protein
LDGLSNLVDQTLTIQDSALHRLLIAVEDRLKGFPEAINSATPSPSRRRFLRWTPRCAKALKVLSVLVPRDIIVVLGPTDDAELTRIGYAMGQGDTLHARWNSKSQCALSSCLGGWAIVRFNKAKSRLGLSRPQALSHPTPFGLAIGRGAEGRLCWRRFKSKASRDFRA